MGKLTDLNPPVPVADADIPGTITRDIEYIAADTAHVNATDPHLQYPTQSRGDSRYRRIYGQSFWVAPNASQSIVPNTATKIFFNSTLANIGNQFANGRITAFEPERWDLTTYICFELVVTSQVVLAVYKNGVPLKRLLQISALAGFHCQELSCFNISLVAGNYLELYATIYSSNGKIYGDTNLDACWWEGRRIA